MDPASAIGLAAAAAQFLALTTKVALGAWRAVGSARHMPLEAQELHDASIMFGDMVKSLDAQLDTSSKGNDAAPETKLRDVCIECRDQSQELRNSIEKIAQKVRDGSCVRSLWEALKQQLGGGQLKKMAESLAKHQRHLVSITIACLWEDTRRKGEILTDIRVQITELQALMEQCIVKSKGEPQRDKLITKLSKSNESLATMDLKDGATRSILSRMLTSWEERDWQPEPSNIAQARLPEFIPLAKKVAKCLYFEGMRTRHDDINPPDESTFEWIWERTPETIDGTAKWSSLPDWLEADGQEIYWITGRPGSGKSTLMRFIEGHPKLPEHLFSFGNPELPLHVWSFYAWNPGNDAQKSIKGLTRSILVQGLASMPELVSVVLPRRWAFETTFRGVDYPSNWHLEDMETLGEGLHRFLAESRLCMRTAILVDGLDEFDSPPSELIMTLHSIAAHGGTKLCVASRPWMEFRDEFAASPCLAVHELTARDIQVSIQKRFQLCRAARERPEEVHHLTEKITEAAAGVYQWVTVVVSYITMNLSSGESLALMLRIIDELPKELSRLYTAIWNRIPTDRRVKANEIFSWEAASISGLRYEALWAINERHAEDLSILDQAAKDPRRLKKLASRLLASQTMGLLEINSVGAVSYMHRTVAEWVNERKFSECDTLASRMALIHGLCTLGPRIRGRINATDSMTEDYKEWGRYILEEIFYQVRQVTDNVGSEDPVTVMDQIVKWLIQLEHYWTLPGYSDWFKIFMFRNSSKRYLGSSLVSLSAFIGFEPFVKAKILDESCFDIGILYLCCLYGGYCHLRMEISPSDLHVVVPSGRTKTQIAMIRLYMATYAKPSRWVEGEVQFCTWREAAKVARTLAKESADSDPAEAAYYSEVCELLEDRARIEEEQKGVSRVFGKIKAPANRLSLRWTGKGSGSQ